MKRALLAVTLIVISQLFCSELQARQIHLNFPHFAGHTYDWIIFQGEKEVTVLSGDIDSDGRITLTMPEPYNDYRGMTRWLLKTGGGLDMIYVGNGFSVECLSEYPSDDTIIYTGNPENDFLKSRHKRQSEILEKLGAVNHLLQVYKPEEGLYGIASEEQTRLRQQFEHVQADRKQSSLYAARFGEIVDFTRGIADKMYENPEDHTAYFNDFVTYALDFKDLYTSGHWDQVLHHWIMMNIRSEKEDRPVVDRLNKVLSRMDRNEILSAFAEKAVPLLVQTGKDDLLPLIAVALNKRPGAKDGLSDSVEHMMTSSKILTGTKAPDLIFKAPVRTQTGIVNADVSIETRNLGADRTILLFYKGGCQLCEDALIALANGYKLLNEKNVRVIAISGDQNEPAFEEKLPYHQWPDNYCDFSGMRGGNFGNYAVLGVPTLYLLDGKGMILEKTAMVDELMGIIEAQ